MPYNIQPQKEDALHFTQCVFFFVKSAIGFLYFLKETFVYLIGDSWVEYAMGEGAKILEQCLEDLGLLLVFRLVVSRACYCQVCVGKAHLTVIYQVAPGGICILIWQNIFLGEIGDNALGLLAVFCKPCVVLFHSGYTVCKQLGKSTEIRSYCISFISISLLK